MAFPTRVNSKAASVWTSTTATTLASGTQSATAGNTLVVCVGGLASASQTVTGIADTAGNTFTKVDHVIGTDNYREEIWYAKNLTGNAANNVTVTWSAAIGFRAIVVLQYAGLSTTAPFDTTAKGTAAAAATTVTTGTFTSTAFDAFHVLLPRWGLAPDVPGYPTGFTEVAADANALVGERPIRGAITGGTYSITHTNTSNAKLILLATFTSGVSTVAEHRVTQDAIELVTQPVPEARITQALVELLAGTTSSVTAHETTQALFLMP